MWLLFLAEFKDGGLEAFTVWLLRQLRTLYYVVLVQLYRSRPDRRKDGRELRSVCTPRRFLPSHPSHRSAKADSIAKRHRSTSAQTIFSPARH